MLIPGTFQESGVIQEGLQLQPPHEDYQDTWVGIHHETLSPAHLPLRF